MNDHEISKLDELFSSYNYEISNKSNSKVRIYTMRYGMYHAAEIVPIDDSFDISKIKAEYSELGYATEVRKFSADIEEYLFEGFFIKTPLGNELKNRYSQFVNKQLQNLPDGSSYEYIKCAYDLMFQNEEGVVVENKQYNGVTDMPLISKINQYLTEIEGALFIIIEAAAGFGKTCTANEVLNTFSTVSCRKLPFFTELSRNRDARVFKHILLNEIDKQFPAGIKQNIVLEQIYKGRIPLIIDGFDELITKESNKEEVESMLTTIVDLLKGDAKIIITSRKTAILNSVEFLKSVYDTDESFSVARIEISEPAIDNWFDNDRKEIIIKSNFPIDQISNPVLLSYLRNISIEKLEEYLTIGDGTLIDKYIDHLLKREQVRQEIKLNNESQLRIFRKLVRFMSEYNFTSESKDTIKDFIKDYNQKILKNSINEYLDAVKPTIEDLVETLSNHVFLDRRSSGNVGFVNDFIFGMLVGENLILEKYQKYYPEFYNLIPQDFAWKAVEAFKVHSNDKKIKLWNIFNGFPFHYEVNFYFEIDNCLKKEFLRIYDNLIVSDIEIKNKDFNQAKFNGTWFSNMSFSSCNFNIDNFTECTFNNCSFYNCTYLLTSNLKVFNDFALFACSSNNNFIESINLSIETLPSEIVVQHELSDLRVLRHFFCVDGIKTRPRKISELRIKLSEFSPKEIGKVITSLKSKDFLNFKNDIGYITKKGIVYYNQNKLQL